MEGSRQGDVVDIVPGRVGERPVLAPASHPSIHEPRVSGEEGLRTQSQALHHTGAESLDQRVGPLNQFERDLSAFLALQVNRYRTAATVQHAILRISRYP